MKSKKEFSILTDSFFDDWKGLLFYNNSPLYNKKIPFENSKGIFLYKIN